MLGPRSPAAIPLSREDQDWWQRRHADKQREIREKPPALIFLGDSIIHQCELTASAPWGDFLPVWQHFYGDRQAANLGFAGDETRHLLWRIENGECVGIAPKVAVVLIGANNLAHPTWSAGDSVAGIRAVVAALRRHLPTTKLLLLGVLPSDRGARITAVTLAINATLAAAYRRSRTVAYRDLGHVFMANGKLNQDLFVDPKLRPPDVALHPSAQGMAQLAAALEPTLAALLGDRLHAAMIAR